MSIDTQFLRHHSDVLEYALGKLNLTDPDEVSHDMYGAACLKEFEIVLQQSGSLLRKILGGYLADNRRLIAWFLRIFSVTPRSTA